MGSCQPSTTTNLLETLQDWTLALAIHSKRSVFAIYIDFAKAFDTVSHNKLIHKLSCYGISGNLLQWIKVFSVVALNKPVLAIACRAF